LVGGNITIQSGTPEGGTTQSAKLSAPGGQINLASVASPGEVLFPTLQSAPNVNGQSFTAMGNINLSEGALLDVTADAAGTVRIRGGQLVIADATISADTGNNSGAPIAVDINMTSTVSIADTHGLPAISARATGSGDAGSVQISAANVNATSSFDSPPTPDFGTPPFTLIDTHTSGSGKGGDVTITATGNLIATGPILNNLFLIDSGTTGLAGGTGGDVTIKAQNIQLTRSSINTGDFVARNLFQDAVGSGGNLSITADTFQLDGSGLTTSSFGARAGDFSLTARDIQMKNFGLIEVISLEGGSTLTIKADKLVADSISFENDTAFAPGGGITFTANVIELMNGTTVRSSTFGDAPAGDIHITATDHLTLADDPTSLGSLIRPSGLFSNSFGDLGSLGNAGSIVVTSPRVQLTGGARIDTTTQTSGRGGDVTITATTMVSLSGERSNEIPEELFNLGSSHPSGIFTRTIGGSCTGVCGNAGHISINTGSLSLSNGAQINSGTSSSGQGGNVNITATDTIALTGRLSTGQPGGIQSRSTGTDADAGTGGNISLIAGQSVNISNGASVSVSTSGPGDAGSILVKANDITISGGGTITAASTGAGNAGIVTIQGLNSPVNSLSVDGTGSGIFTNTEDTGAGGNILINADTVTLSNGGTLSAKTSGTTASAVGGMITVDAPNSLTMTNGAHITASSTGPANTGDIQITAGNHFAMTNSSVTTEATQSGGGIIKITTNPNGTVQLTDSMISASVLDGTGGGGSVNIDPEFVILQNSQILANAIFGPGGNINITTNVLLPDTTSVISASSQFGQQGTIVIQSPVSPASGKIVPLGQKPLIQTSLISQRCAAVADGKSSSFTIAGRDTLPAEPGNWLSSPLALNVSGEGDASPTSQSPTQEVPLLSLRRIAPPGFLIQNFAVDSAGCTS
jgi:large exoprotein involved in heme utilization and adhesion